MAIPRTIYTRYSLVIDEHAVADLRALPSRAAQAQLIVLFGEIEGDQMLLGQMLSHNFGVAGGEKIEIKKWLRVSKDVWRLKCCELESKGLRYRIPYVFDAPNAAFRILAIVQRGKLDYDDPQDAIAQRITARCRELGIGGFG